MNGRIQKLLFAASLAFFLTFLGKASGFARDVIFSAYFGAGTATDAFFIANMIPGILWLAVLTTATVVFLPLYVEERERDKLAARSFAREVVQIYVLLAMAIGALCVVGAGLIVRVTAPGASLETASLARTLTVMMAAGFVFSGYVAVQNAIQQAEGQYQPPLAVPVINNLIAIVGVIVAARFADVRIAVAFAVGAWAIQAPFQRWQTRVFYDSTRRWLIRSPTMRRLSALSLPVMLGTFLDQINIFVGIYLASALGAGAISELNYASRLALFMASTFSTLIAYFLFPRFARGAALDDTSDTASTLTTGLLAVAATTAPLIFISLLMKNEIVTIVYGHGHMLPSQLVSTAAAFAWYAAGIIFIAVRDFLNRLFFAYQRNTWPLYIGIVSTATNLAASALLVRSMGTAGIALGATIGAGVYFAGQIGAVLLWKPKLLERRMFVGMSLLAAAMIPAALTITALHGTLLGSGMGAFLRLAVTGVVSTATFAVVVLVAAKAFRFPLTFR